MDLGKSRADQQVGSGRPEKAERDCRCFFAEKKIK